MTRASKASPAPPRPLPDSHVEHVAWSPQGSHFAVAAYRPPALVCDAATGEIVCELPVAGRKLAWTRDGSRLLTAHGRGAALWDIPSGKRLQQWSGHKHQVNAVAWSPDESLVITGSGEPHTPSDYTARLWPAPGGASTRTVPFGSEVGVVAMSPDGALLAIAGRGGPRVRLVDTATWRVRADVRLPCAASSVHFLPDGRLLAAAAPPCIIDVARGTIEQWLEARRWVPGQPADVLPWLYRIVATPSGPGPLVLLCGDGNDRLVVQRLHTASLRVDDIGVLPARGVRAAAVSPDGEDLLTGHDAAAGVWSLRDGGALRLRLPAHASDAMEVPPEAARAAKAPEDEELLWRRLDDDDYEVRDAARRALWRGLDEERAIERLKGASYPQRSTALVLLAGRLHQPAVERAHREAMRGDDPFLRRAATQQLALAGQLGPDDLSEVAAMAAREEQLREDIVRWLLASGRAGFEAAEALGQSGDAGLCASLLRAAPDNAMGADLILRWADHGSPVMKLEIAGTWLGDGPCAAAVLPWLARVSGGADKALAKAAVRTLKRTEKALSG